MSSGRKQKKTRQGSAGGFGAKTLFVCVRERGKDGGASCGGRGARKLMNAMRSALEAEEISRDELDVCPCGCLGLCKKGPVLVAATGEAAADKRPPKAKKEAPGVYTRVAGHETRAILRELLVLPAPHER